MAFCARFLKQGRARLNAAYACIAAADHMKLDRRLVMISKEMIEDARDMWRDISEGRWTPLVVSPNFHMPGVQGASSDASGSLEKGWGAHAFGAFPYGVWAPRTRRLIEQRKLSINALELLAAAMAVVLVDKAGMVPRGGRFALKCDNDMACAAANYGVTASAAMREALRMWGAESGGRGLTVRLLYVDTKSNSIADALSRLEVGKALSEIGRRGWERKEFQLGELFARWEAQIWDRLKSKRVFLSVEQEDVLAQKAEEAVEEAAWAMQGGA